MVAIIEASRFPLCIVAIETLRGPIHPLDISSGIYGAKLTVLGLIAIDHALRLAFALIIIILVHEDEFRHIRVWLGQMKRRGLGLSIVFTAYAPMFGIKNVILWCVEVAGILGNATAFCN